MRRGIVFLLLQCSFVWIACLPLAEAFQSAHPTFGTTASVSRFESKTTLFDAPEDTEVEVGSKDYYDGFLSSPIQDETVAERGSGLEQALKLGGGFAAVLAVLFVGFMASNGLI